MYLWQGNTLRQLKAVLECLRHHMKQFAQNWHSPWILPMCVDMFWMSPPCKNNNQVLALALTYTTGACTRTHKVGARPSPGWKRLGKSTICAASSFEAWKAGGRVNIKKRSRLTSIGIPIKKIFIMENPKLERWSFIETGLRSRILTTFPIEDSKSRQTSTHPILATGTLVLTGLSWGATLSQRHLGACKSHK